MSNIECRMFNQLHASAEAVCMRRLIGICFICHICPQCWCLSWLTSDSVDPNRTSRSLIWVYTVFSGMSVPNLSKRTTKATVYDLCNQQRLRSDSLLIACAFYSLQVIQRGIYENPCHTWWMYRLIWVFDGYTGLLPCSGSFMVNAALENTFSHVATHGCRYYGDNVTLGWHYSSNNQNSACPRGVIIFL